MIGERSGPEPTDVPDVPSLQHSILQSPPPSSTSRHAHHQQAILLEAGRLDHSRSCDACCNYRLVHCRGRTTLRLRRFERHPAISLSASVIVFIPIQSCYGEHGSKRSQTGPLGHDASLLDNFIRFRRRRYSPLGRQPHLATLQA